MSMPTGWTDDGTSPKWGRAEPVPTTYQSGRYQIDMRHGIRTCTDCGARVDLPEIHDSWHEAVSS